MYVIRLATLADLDGIALMLRENSSSRGGALTGDFSTDKVEAMLRGGLCNVLALREGKVAGALFSSEASRLADSLVVRAMRQAWPGSSDAYVYGPVCVAQAERGMGLSGKLYARLQQELPGREAILFIRKDNAASLNAHFKLGMREVAAYTLDGLDYVVLSGAPQP
ncbi:GNAT family N-acetyltransferase [Chromobacterium sphagni]|uniref:N-acetyltransferase domain-containing protein n=1 Tax=Chromobacterium sphagni TaxID=1903179 RepID=A0ABX3CBM8_9NEIS|nr:GNAT family N-acetyltransferase [Chromobacterium sphagni]OHX19611.1 hypothetical protein BI344_17660 [Chromobacterium sphagni]